MQNQSPNNWLHKEKQEINGKFDPNLADLDDPPNFNSPEVADYRYVQNYLVQLGKLEKSSKFFQMNLEDQVQTNEKFTEIKEKYSSTLALYEDPTFPPNSSSISNVADSFLPKIE